MSRILVRAPNLFIGDVLFGSVVFGQLGGKWDMGPHHYCVDVMQPIELLNLNPMITKTFYQEFNSHYDTVYELKPLITQGIPATFQFLEQVAITPDPRYPGYNVYTNPSNDYAVDLFYREYRQQGKKIVAFQNNWIEKSFGFSREEYWQGVNKDPLGYGGRRRNIEWILGQLELQNDLFLIPVGKEAGYNQRNADIYSSTSYAFAASLMKMADVLIGGEGGITNCGAPNVRCIITTDYIAQLYGRNGCIRKHDKPTMGPATYFPDKKHVHLDPYLTDAEVVEQLLYWIRHPNENYVYDWSKL